MNPGPNSALDASVLVLNKLFMAIHIISVRRAFCLLCKDLAEVVSLEDGQFATYSFQTWREVSEFRARHFRQEDDGKGLSSYPHPWLMPKFWQFPTVSMGLGPITAIYQARFMKYLRDRGILDTDGRKV